MKQRFSSLIGLLLLLVAISPPRVSAYASGFKYHMDMSEKQKQEFVDAHNHFRRLVQPEASNMRFMTWDVELEAFAKNFVKKCSFRHTPNDQLKTSVFGWIGENLYTGAIFYFSQIPTKDGVTKLWFDEFPDYDYASSTCTKDKKCGHYTQVAWAESYKVGCAAAACSSIDSGGTPPIILACHYGPGGNFVSHGKLKRPYRIGTACSECDDGDTCSGGLCTNTERDMAPATTTSTNTATKAQPVNPAGKDGFKSGSHVPYGLILGFVIPLAIVLLVALLSFIYSRLDAGSGAPDTKLQQRTTVDKLESPYENYPTG